MGSSSRYCFDNKTYLVFKITIFTGLRVGAPSTRFHDLRHPNVKPKTQIFLIANAAKLAGWVEIPSEVVEADDARAIVIATSTNLIKPCWTPKICKDTVPTWQIELLARIARSIRHGRW